VAGIGLAHTDGFIEACPRRSLTQMPRDSLESCPGVTLIQADADNHVGNKIPGGGTLL